MPWKFEDAIPVIGSITEGPAWDGEHLFFTNIALDRVLRFDPGSGVVSVFRTGTNGANGLNFDAQGRLYACEGRGRRIARYDPDGTSSTVVDRLHGRRINGPNDLAIDPKGRIWFSDPYAGQISPSIELDHASILRADPLPDGSYACTRATFDVTGPNGLLFSQDYKTLYVAQSDWRAIERRELRAYPVNADGSLGKYQVLHDFGPHRGIDGMTLDSQGRIVACAGWEGSGPGGMIYVFEPNGRIVETHPTPCERPTNCTFVGSDLYVTSIEGHLLRVRDTGMTGYLIYP
ncbi:MAG: SMP-30/gluconolactonase/LRE family protein [SAR202 cluster bacterium]|nr:SMP-30/gluconolactonase/LRE family protein [SAR202 cluster bacterium]